MSRSSRSCEAGALLSVSGFGIVYDADGVTMYVGTGSPLEITLTDFELTETENVTASTHQLRSTVTGNVLKFVGTPKYATTRFTGVLADKIGLDWAPTDTTRVLELAKAKSTTTGALKVTSGTVRLVEEAKLTALSSLTVSEGATLSVAAGSYIRTAALTVNGVAMPSGVYRNVDWFKGDGYVYVTKTAPAIAATATWIGGTGASLATDGNWEGGKVPDLTSGATHVVLRPASGVSTLTVPDGTFLGGVEFQLPSGCQMTLSSETVGGKLYIGKDGIVVTGSDAAAKQTFALPVVLVAGGVSLNPGAFDGTSRSFDFLENLYALGGEIKLEGKGRIDCRKDVEAEGNVFRVLSVNNGLMLHGVTVDGSVHGSLSNSSGWMLASEAGTTNVLKGGVGNYNGIGYTAYSLNQAQTGGGFVIIEGGVSGNSNCGIYNVRIDKTPMTLLGRLFPASADGGEVYLNVASNQMGRNSFIMGNGVNVHCLVPYAYWGGPRTQYSGTYLQAQIEVQSNRSASLDLGGFDQEVTGISVERSSTYTITSETPAQLHLDFKWPLTFTEGATRDYAYTCYVKFAGGAGLTFEGKDEEPFNTFALINDSTTTGKLAVASGKLTMKASDGHTGTWPNASAVEVTGGTLVLTRSATFGDQVAVALDSKGKLQLDAGVRQKCATLTLNGIPAENGTYGSSQSAATYKRDDYFTGTGVLKVGKLGLFIVVE